MKNRLTHTLLGIVAFLVLVLMPARAEDEGGAPKRVVKSPQQEAKDRAAAFMAAAKQKPGVVVTPSGLCYVIVNPGTPPLPKPTDIVKASYTGKLSNGTVFESTQARGPVEFPLTRVIRGWTEGLQKVGTGGKIILYVPPELAYGEQRRRGIPAGSALEFEVEIISIREAPPFEGAP
ncbi:MAG TPA: FKBP-type peptidyl-prolyl cis-trans isomerase [Opitutaceae bacterium]|nr:FKBP-type peptidyl-prolyl cis-trans isomerase [Opitutaceae bacterium]HND60870.1 FKBP-type peptidyl-prolyl cis-trans isomerase [Opitutaceae bacterium]